MPQYFLAPCRDLVIDDIRAMLGEDSLRESLFSLIREKLGVLRIELTRFANYATRIKVVGFYETNGTRKLVVVRHKLRVSYHVIPVTKY